jgi:hypothetical protein
MMTKPQITAAVTAIRARHAAEKVEGAVPVTMPWKAFPPVTMLTNACASRGHVVDQLGDCAQCEQRRPARGGFSRACPNDRRVFQGGS